MIKYPPAPLPIDNDLHYNWGQMLRFAEDAVELNKPKEYISHGWKCPSCGRGNAPWSATCPCTSYTLTTPSTWPLPGTPFWH